jgi:hypothetical protein
MPDVPPSLDIHYPSDDDMHLDTDPDICNKAPDLDADGESVDDDANSSTVNSSTVNTSHVARLSLSRSRPPSVRVFFSFLLPPLSHPPPLPSRTLLMILYASLSAPISISHL